MTTLFKNEHLVPGQAGQFLALFAFVTALLSMVAYFQSARSSGLTAQQSWKRYARIIFSLHATAVAGIFLTLFYIIFQHYFEYHYAWSHSSKELPFKYLLSCFWEGQEGSFLLWTIWNGILGWVAMRSAGKWEAPVMSILTAVQVFLASMLLGLYFFNQPVGSDPFILLRERMTGAPIFQQADYLEFVRNGNGLNPLLQNYWMVIHPPVLFLGFASTLLPFAYAVAALWKQDYEDLVQPLLRWSLFSGAVLGTGIMMGGAWAYESLSFGGYWAWDPVENASLVPWIVMLAGLHTTLIYKASGYSLRSTLLFFILSFSLVLYSTFLTRTGILGETSVHAFTGEGSSLSYHLVIFLFAFLLPALVLFFIRWKRIPDLHQEEEAWNSREFWMYIGALVMMIAVVQITYTTSMPVWNKLFHTKLAITDPVSHYNRIQIWVSILIALGTACLYYLKFKQSSLQDFLRKLAAPFLLSIPIAALIIYQQGLGSVPIGILTGMAVFSVLANLFYLLRVMKGRVLKWGGPMAHIGFGLMLVGIVLSSYNKQVISVNHSGFDFDMGKKTDAENQKESRENVLLFKNMPLQMGAYQVTYLGDTVAEPNHYYKVRYQRRQQDTGRVEVEFILRPNAQINPKMGLISSPDTKHYLTHDIFTYITSTVDKSKQEDTATYSSRKMQAGDSVILAAGHFVFQGFNTRVPAERYPARAGDIAVAARLQVWGEGSTNWHAEPVYYIRDQQETLLADTLWDLNLIVRLAKIIPAENAAIIEYRQAPIQRDYVIMKAILFPYINVLWLGTIIMVLGFLLSLLKRIRAK